MTKDVTVEIVRCWLMIWAVAGCSFSAGHPGSLDDAGNQADSDAIDAPALQGSDAFVFMDAPAPACNDGIKNGTELDIDCGGTCPACTTVFSTDANTLALLELNGDVLDSSGNNRNATLAGGSFVSTSWGMGLSLAGQPGQGFDWGFASLLVHPYTVEMVVTPSSVACFKKLFGTANNVDAGWYYCTKFQSYPQATIGPTLTANQRHYLAMVSTASNQIDVYLNGTMIGSTQTFTAPPASAIFFRDDTVTNNEHISAVIDAVRISNIARSAPSIAAVAARLAVQP